jgi:hydroxymethylglutaryl-CoA reductase
MATQQMNDLFEGFSKLDKQQRFARLIEMGALSIDDVKYLNQTAGLPTDLAEKFIENVIGYFQLPLGVAANLCIDGKDYAVPMAVEETSIIAAVSKTAKWIKNCGEITTQTLGHDSIGQIQLAKVNNFAAFEKAILANKDRFIQAANRDVAHGLVSRGGGITDIVIRKIPRNDNLDMAVLHVHVNTCDAMGANIINQVCEYLKEPVQILTGEKVTMCILSNLNDTKLTQAKVVLQDIDPTLGEANAESSLFAQYDPYRAATNNKGVLNGIDPILIATGNDWRAVEAGIHAYASRSGQYRSITQWTFDGKNLMGIFEAPIAVGIVGGVTKLHPTAILCLNMLGVANANHLARIIAAVGLVQNLGALTALSTVGIIQGHMKLHITNLTLGAGAQAHEVPYVQRKLEEILRLTKRVSLSHAVEVLDELRTLNTSPTKTVAL